MKLSLVTGANSELGVSICKFLLKKKYKVIACIHEKDELIKQIINDNLIIRKIDLCNEKEIIDLVKGEEFNLIINAAAYYFDDELKNITKKNIMKTLEVNVASPLLISKYAKLKNGIVINISSTDGIDTYNKINIPYSVSKAGLNLLTKNLAYAIKDVKFYALALGWLDTKMILEIDEYYLKSEMERCNQKELISLDYVNSYIEKILNNEFESGEIIRIDNYE